MKRKKDAGATTVEYALMLVFILGIIAGAIFTLGLHVIDLFTSLPDF